MMTLLPHIAATRPAAAPRIAVQVAYSSPGRPPAARSKPCLVRPGRQAAPLAAGRAVLNSQPTSQPVGHQWRAGHYQAAEAILERLLVTSGLDEETRAGGAAHEDAEVLLQAIETAKIAAYSPAGQGDAANYAAHHLFLQRVLYKINRLVFFWFGDLAQYTNEDSIFLSQLRSGIEEAWQQWEMRSFQRRAEELYPAGALPDAATEIKAELCRLGSVDVAPPQSPTLTYISEQLTMEGYKHLLAITSLDGLVEASRQSRVCAGVGNEVSCMVFKVLSEEYGSGRLARKHSTVFAKMMAEVGLDSTPERYFSLAPWQLLRSINYNFMLTEKRRMYLRYLGGLTFFELSGPNLYSSYLRSARRLGLSDAASSYWELHIREDERHGAQMLAEVALPLVDLYPANAQEVLQGYLQEKWIGEEAGAAIVAACKAQEAGLVASQ